MAEETPLGEKMEEKEQQSTGATTMEEAAGEVGEDTAEEPKKEEPLQGLNIARATPAQEEKEEEEKPKEEPKAEKPKDEESTHIFALRTTANREDQVMDFLESHITKKGLNVFSVIRAHGMRGYIFIEAASRLEAEQAAHGIPYARGILPNEIDYSEVEHMIEPVKRELNIRKNDIVEIISGPFKRETAKITRIDEQKEEVVVELVEAAVPIPITLKIDSVKVIRRDADDDKE
ncbi:transcription elongation factor Spt5 [Candidatus Woesearchaeota archaeon]|nr:transcription elongation factor Spt5 [Candidatus Woesearchaeota archaeon]